MGFFNLIYCYFFALVLRTPSRENATWTSSLLVSTVVVVHIIGLLSVLEKITHYDFVVMFGKTEIVAAVFLIVCIFCYYYLVKKKGEAVTREFGEGIKSTRSALIGLAITIWTFGFPFVCGVLLTLCSGSQKS